MKRSLPRAFLLVFVHCVAARRALAQSGPAAESPSQTPAQLPTVLRPEDWAVNFQATYVWQTHDSFGAKYDGPHSLSSKAETGYSLTSTLYLGHRLWRGAALFFNPEVIQSEELSELHGQGGLSNGENQKTGGPTAKMYSARLFIRQTINLAERDQVVEAGANQFAETVARRRIVITAGQMALVDVFDSSGFAHDARTQFLNWALIAQGASDYAADARGYTWGLAVEYYRDDWAFRWGHFAQPKESNGLALDHRLWAHFGENVEAEHGHVLLGQPGKVRLMSFFNYTKMGGFRDAIAFASGAQPDVANVRHDRAKLGFGIHVEQSLARELGAFARFNWNDGRTETYAFAEIDRSFSIGAVARGGRWFRPADTVGLAYVRNAISAAHRDYLAVGGLGNFIGDGRLNYRPEHIIEAYYSFRAFAGLWFSLDGQYIFNPAYNADRGPVAIGSFRVHAEY